MACERDRRFGGRRLEPSIEQSLRALHQDLRGTRGAAATRVDVDCAAGTVRVAGAGNVAATLVDRAGRKRTLLVRPGTFGAEVGPLLPVEVVPDEGLLVVATDGIGSNWSFDAERAPPQLQCAYAAAELIRHYGKLHHDAACVVVPIGGSQRVGHDPSGGRSRELS